MNPRFKQKINEIRAKKAQDESQRETEQEMERRENGKKSLQVQEELKKKKVERDIKQLDTDKKEEALARQKIREKIELDKLERKNARKRDQHNLKSSLPQKDSLSISKATTDIAFRLADGSVIRSEFQSTDSLQSCKQFIRNVRTKKRQFKLNILYLRPVVIKSSLS